MTWKGKSRFVFSTPTGRIGLAAALLLFATASLGFADALDNWTQRSSGVGQNLYGVSYGNGRYVCVGQAGRILVSSNGVSWQVTNLGVTNYLYGVAFAAGNYVVVGSGGLILRSSDAVNWSPQTSSTTNQLNSVAFCGGQYITTGNAGTLLTSPDGTTWTPQVSGTTRNLVGSAFGNNLFIAVGRGQSNPGTLLTSSNAVDWVDRSYLQLSAALYGSAFGNGVFAAIGARAELYYSTNGTNWAFRFAGSATSYVNALAFGQGLFVGVGDLEYPTGLQKIVTSPSGANWKLRPVPPGSSAPLRAVTYGNGSFIAVGEKGLIFQSDPVFTLSSINSSGSPMLLLDGEIGRTYRIQARTNLTSGSWGDVLTVTNTSEVTQYPAPVPGDAPVGFYRAVTP